MDLKRFLHLGCCHVHDQCMYPSCSRQVHLSSGGDAQAGDPWPFLLKCFLYVTPPLCSILFGFSPSCGPPHPGEGKRPLFPPPSLPAVRVISLHGVLGLLGRLSGVLPVSLRQVQLLWTLPPAQSTALHSMKYTFNMHPFDWIYMWIPPPHSQMTGGIKFLAPCSSLAQSHLL